MSRLTLMRTQSSFPLHGREHGKKWAGIPPVFAVYPGAESVRISSKLPSPCANLRTIEPIEKIGGKGAVVAAPRILSCEQDVMMHITIDARGVTQLRRLVIGTCGEMVSFMRVQPVAHATKMKVWLRLSKAAVHLIMDVVMRTLSSAEFGPITKA
jgi:hypothetical protein